MIIDMASGMVSNLKAFVIFLVKRVVVVFPVKEIFHFKITNLNYYYTSRNESKLMLKDLRQFSASFLVTFSLRICNQKKKYAVLKCLEVYLSMLLVIKFGDNKKFKKVK